nr:methyltransferase [Nakamurella aerolata]
MTDLDAVDALGADLRAAGYDAVGVPSLLGASANGAMARGEFWPALRATAAAPGPLATVVRLFLLGTSEPVAEVAAALPSLGVERAVVTGVLEPDGELLRAAVDIRPHAATDADGRADHEYLVVSDLDSDTRPGPVRHDHVLGIGAASMSLAGAVIRTPVRTALDLGTGCGIQALHIGEHADSVVATDTNPRALALAAATARLNGQHWDLRSGSLFEPVAGQRFDLIVSNPPFVIGTGEQSYIYRDSGMAGDAVCEQLIRGIPEHLNPGGVATVLANWLVFGDDDWRGRIGSWVGGTGCDAWVVQREFADPAHYISMWLADAGEDRTTAARTGAEWLDYFERSGVRGIGMGVVTLRKLTDAEAAARQPDQVLDEITAAGEEVTGAAAEAFLAARRLLVTRSDDELLDLRLRLAPDALLTERSLAGHDGWTTVLRMLERQSPGAHLQLDDWGRSLLAGCTGQLPLRLLLELLAGANGVDEAALTQAMLPTVRTAVGRGLLLVEDTSEGAAGAAADGADGDGADDAAGAGADGDGDGAGAGAAAGTNDADGDGAAGRSGTGTSPGPVAE